MISKESKQKKRKQGSQIKATVIQEVTSYGILSRYRLEIKPKIGAKKTLFESGSWIPEHLFMLVQHEKRSYVRSSAHSVQSSECIERCVGNGDVVDIYNFSIFPSSSLFHLI